MCKITCFVGSDSDIGRRKKKIAVGSDDEGSQGKIDASETTNMIKAKLYMNVHWMVLYKFTFFVPV